MNYKLLRFICIAILICFSLNAKTAFSERRVEGEILQHLVETEPRHWEFKQESKRNCSTRRSYSVLTGSFETEEDAKRLRNRLKKKEDIDKQGIYLNKAFSENTLYYNVLVGKYKQQEQANNTINRLRKKENLIAAITTVSKIIYFSIFVDAFLTKQEAQNLQLELTVEKYDRESNIHIEEYFLDKEQNWIVMAGNENKQLSEAYRILSQLKQNGKNNAVITKEKDIPPVILCKEKYPDLIILTKEEAIRRAFKSQPEPEPDIKIYHKYTIQAASYLTKEDTLKGLEKFIKNNLPSLFVVKEGKWWRIFVGDYKTWAEAEKTRNKLKGIIHEVTQRKDSWVRKTPDIKNIKRYPEDF